MVDFLWIGNEVFRLRIGEIFFEFFDFSSACPVNSETIQQGCSSWLEVWF